MARRSHRTMVPRRPDRCDQRARDLPKLAHTLLQVLAGGVSALVFALLR